MVGSFQNKNYWALILGGSSGLGLASAQKLANEGMGICIVHRNSRSEMQDIRREFDAIAKKTHFMSFNMDASLPETISSVIAALQANGARIRLLLHSVARGSLKPVHGENSLEPEDIAITVESMASSLLGWTKALHESGHFHTDARVLAFTSEGSRRPIPGYAAVSMAKAALEALVRSIATEFGPFGIRANCIQAGVTATRSMLAIPGSEEIIRHANSRNPLGRNTLPSDIADIVYLMCRDESAWINGTVICADGGESLQ